MAGKVRLNVWEEMLDKMVTPVGEALGRARLGEVASFALVYDQFSRQIYSFAYRLLGNHAQAEDVTQETFLRAWQRLHQLRDESRLESWLYAIASNQCTDIVRRRRLIAWLPLVSRHEELPDSKPPVGSSLAEQDIVQEVLRALPPKYAVPLVLRHVEGFSCQEIAEMLRLSVDNVWQRLSRGRDMFAQRYGEAAKVV